MAIGIKSKSYKYQRLLDESGLFIGQKVKLSNREYVGQIVDFDYYTKNNPWGDTEDVCESWVYVKYLAPRTSPEGSQVDGWKKDLIKPITIGEPILLIEW